MFRLTVLRAPGKRLVKTFTADGRKRGTDKAARFLVERPEVADARAFFALLGGLERRPDCCVIRGGPGRWFPTGGGPVRRLLHPQPAYADALTGRRVLPEEVRRAGREGEVGETLFHATALPMFAEEATPWVLADMDGLEHEPGWRADLAGTAMWLRDRFPEPFRGASCWYQATAGAADPSKPDLGGAGVRMRLGFVLSRPLTQGQLEAWLAGTPGLDPCTLRTVQEIYVGRPAFEGGLADPLRVRSGVLEGYEDVVEVPDDLPRPAPRSAGLSHVPAANEIGGGEGTGLLDCPALDDALAGLGDGAGTVRAGLGRAARTYLHAVGPGLVDVDALAARLAEVAAEHRSAAEVAGYNLPSLVRWHLARAPRETGAPDPAGEAEPVRPEVEALPDFGPVRADRDAALAEMRGEIAEAIAGAVARIELRRELRRRRQEAAAAAAGAYLAEVGKAADTLDEAERRRLRVAKARAGKAAREAFMAERGLEAMPGREARLFTGSQGSGKTQALARALARVGRGDVTVHVPTLAKADELAAAIEAARPGRMFPVVWRGRLARPAQPGGGGGQTRGAGVFADFDRPRGERMCGRPAELIRKAQRAGCEMFKTFCLECPMRRDCRYLSQLDMLNALKGARIVIAAHEAMFLPMPFASDLVVVDEDVTAKTARAIEIDPARLLDREKWRDADELRPIVEAVAAALARPGGELAALREAGVDVPALKACGAHLRKLEDAAVAAIAEAGAGRASEGTLGGMVDALEVAEHRKLQTLFANLRDELATGREGTNATRLVRARRKMVRDAEGAAVEERLDRYVVSRVRGHGVGRQAEVVLLDGTGDLGLNRRVFGDDVEERRHAVERRGACVQVVSNSNSKRRLLRDAPEAERARRELRRLIGDLSAVLGGSLLVGCTKALRERLAEEGALDGLAAMHFGAERGMNSAEGCEGVLVVGREQPPLPALEDLARGFAAADEAPFRSVLDEKEEGGLPLFRRRRRKRDGSEAWAEVRSHPDRFARALLEQAREAGVAQMADRVRAVWHERVVVIATDLPVDLGVDLTVVRGELALAARLARDAGEAIAGRGWWLRAEPAKRTGDRIGRTRAGTLIGYLLGTRLLFAQFEPLMPSGRHLIPATLLTRLPLVEALRRAAEVHPGVRMPPPEGGVLRECLRRHGLVGTWADLPALVPDLAPDAVAATAVKDAEQAGLEPLKAGRAHAPYRVPGRRGRPGVLVWDPARVADPAAALAGLLGSAVTVEGCGTASPEPARPPSLRLPLLAVVRPSRCARCEEEAEPGTALCPSCAWLAGPPAVGSAPPPLPGLPRVVGSRP